MIYISHRGNVDGPVKDKENNIDHIQKALNKGFEVEVDVRFNKNKFCPNRIKRVKRYAFLANIDIKFKFLAFLFCSFFNQTLTSVFKTI